jgi:hypothetical protein
LGEEDEELENDISQLPIFEEIYQSNMNRLKKISFEIKNVFQMDKETPKRKNMIPLKRTKIPRHPHKKHFKTFEFKIPKPIKNKKESAPKMHLTHS